tara:strand:- start:5217 stop:5618 length:402 start_codon:yes stop_codon:yes gene_type:complete
MSISSSGSDLRNIGYTYRVYGNDEICWQEIDMLNLDEYIKKSISMYATLDDVRSYIMSHAKNKDVEESCRFVVPRLYSYHLSKNKKQKYCIISIKNMYKRIFARRNYNTQFDYNHFEEHLYEEQLQPNSGSEN